MAATITTGLLNVAKIARQKFQSSAGSGGSIGAEAGSNGGGDNTREFNFNLAGSTQSNQLTQSIAGQLSQPIQTYVVSSEITSQQQLDLNIANATINTYLAASQIMADESFATRPVARFVAMAATITTGLLNVAKIARQKFQSSAGSGGSIGAGAGGAGGGEGDSREFNLNLAGSTQSNQLTQSIASQLSQPIQTYVVLSLIHISEPTRPY